MVSGSRARAKGLGLEVTVCRGLEIEYYIINITISIRFAITEHFLCVYFKSRPLILQLCLLWVSLIIKLPSSQSAEPISQSLHGSTPPPPAQNHPLWLRSLSVCLRWHNSAQHNRLVWPIIKNQQPTTSLRWYVVFTEGSSEVYLYTHKFCQKCRHFKHTKRIKDNINIPNLSIL